MRVVVVYESMYGNTHLVAEAIGAGLGPMHDVTVVSTADADRQLIDGADLVVVGGPTHLHGMSRSSTRKAAAGEAAKPGAELSMDTHADGPGVRDWLATIDSRDGVAAAFDTRLHGSPALTGRASKGIARALRHHGFDLVVKPESFLVARDNRLEPDEAERARAWGQLLGARAA